MSDLEKLLGLQSIPVEILESVPPGMALLVNRDMWEQIKGQSSGQEPHDGVCPEHCVECERQRRKAADAEIASLRAEIKSLTANYNAAVERIYELLLEKEERNQHIEALEEKVGNVNMVCDRCGSFYTGVPGMQCVCGETLRDNK